MSRHGGERDRAAGHRADEIPKSASGEASRAEHRAAGVSPAGLSLAAPAPTSGSRATPSGRNADALGRTLYARCTTARRLRETARRRKTPPSAIRKVWTAIPRSGVINALADRHRRAVTVIARARRRMNQLLAITVGARNRAAVKESEMTAEVDDKEGTRGCSPRKRECSRCRRAARAVNIIGFGAVAIDQVADDGRGERSFGARRRKSQRSRGAGELRS